MKQLYLDVMERAANAYTVEQIDDYIREIEEEGLGDHGFPRLASCLAVLLANGRCKALFPRIKRMLDLSFSLVPKSFQCDNDFSVRELCTALFALQKSEAFPKERLDAWAELLRGFDPEEGYEMLVWKKDPDWHCHNIVSYNCLSEFLRCKLLGLDAEPFLNRQLPKLLESFDENGMYMDPGCPMVYDAATRLNLQQMLFAGYCGTYHDKILDLLEKADPIPLKYISVCGDFPYGGRSQGFLHNEALLCALLEGAALRSAKKGNLEEASSYRSAAKLALDCLQNWIGLTPPSHVKNRFPPSELFGCEKYGYFNKYMITVNTWLSNPVLYGDFTIPVGTLSEKPCAFATSHHFHRYFLKAGDYFLQGDLAGQKKQDATGIGRIHKKGCPSPLLLSFPFPKEPKYVIQGENPANAAIGVWKKQGNQILTECDSDTVAVLKECKATEEDASAELQITLSDGSEIAEYVKVAPEGVLLRQDGADGFLLPAILSDGENEGTFFAEKDGFSVLFRGHHARFRFLGKAEEWGVFSNRNGIYRIFRITSDQVYVTMGGKR